jgi:hypothetical protein
MYEWIQGRPPMLLRDRELARWPGNGASARRMESFASIGEFAGGSVLVLRDPELTTVVPLELGGILLVSAVYCDGDRSVSAHLDMLPVSGWEMLPDRFRAESDTYALFDGSLSGRDLQDPGKQKMILEERGGVLRFAMDAGSYEVETLGPWNPDARTELWLTRMVRAAPDTI